MRILGVILSLLASPPDEPEPEAVEVAVEAGGRQSFRGLGTSLGNWGGEYQRLSGGDRERLSGLLWRGLGMRTLRVWQNLDEFSPDATTRTIADFRRRYVDSGIIADARRMGMTELLLAPDAAPGYLKVKREGGPADFAIPDGKIAAYAGLIAELIARLRDEAGVAIDATGIQNEPNDLDRIEARQMAAAARALRGALDGRGLGRVRIIAPEAANVDRTFTEAADVLRADPAAWRALGGLASHSYGMAATPEAAAKVGPAGAGPNWVDYWMTEASDNGPEAAGDAARAASLAGRFLNDMNQRTTHWVHFLGFEAFDPRDDATRIIGYRVDPFRMTIFHKYYYYQQLSAAFDVGAVFRGARSSTEGAMAWSYGPKPRLTAAAARNPDGGWAVGLCNFTSTSFRGDPKEPNGANNGQPARPSKVTVRVAELAGTRGVRFAVRRSGEHLTGADEGSIGVDGGVIAIDVGPLELVTLRSGPVP